jgi:hypothetical protein
MSYAAQQQTALSALTRKGAPIVVRRASSGSYDPLTDTETGGSTAETSSVALKLNPDDDWGPALTVGERAEFWLAALGMAFAPMPGDELEFAGAKWRCDAVRPLDPDGTPILYRCLGGK